MQSDKFFQLNLVDLHIIGATSSSLAVHFVDVFPWTVGATCMSAASTVSLVFLQSEVKTRVGFL